MSNLGIFQQALLIQKQPSYGYLNQQLPDRISASPNLTLKHPNYHLSRSVNTAALTCDSTHRSSLSLLHDGFDLQFERIRENDLIESPNFSENFDELIHSSVTEIVKNLTHAPLLVQIHADGNVSTKKSVEAEEWRNVNKHETTPSSWVEGVVLVEELPAAAEDGGGDRAYGVLIQRKSRSRNECRSSCYLLKTRGVNGGGGLGHVCTHFCLIKVQSFHKSAFQQFTDSWLAKTSSNANFMAYVAKNL